MAQCIALAAPLSLQVNGSYSFPETGGSIMATLGARFLSLTMATILRQLTLCWMLQSFALVHGFVFGITDRNATFDYVVVGGGTAGLAIATRLAERAKSVAVIEAGGFYEIDNGNDSIVPSLDIVGAGSSPMDFNPLVDWGFVTVPQKVNALWHNQSLMPPY